MSEDLYSVLGVSKTADLATIKKTFRKLAKDLHPDRTANDKKKEARFKAVNNAFNVLSDPNKRKLYDEFGEDGLREGFDANQARQYKQWSGRQGGRGGRTSWGGDGETVNLEDLFSGQAQGRGGFSDLFGDMFGGGQQRRGPAARGGDAHAEVTIDFVSSVRGTTLELQQQGGGAPVTVRVPAGAHDGSRLRIRGHGGPSPNGGPSGDLLLDIHVQPHKFFRREGDHLHLDVPITIAEAYQGAKIKVPTPDGDVTLKVPPRTQGGSVMRLKGKGVAKKGKEVGDLYVHYEIKIPQEDSEEVAELVEQLAKHQSGDVRHGIAF